MSIEQRLAQSMRLTWEAHSEFLGTNGYQPLQKTTSKRAHLAATSYACSGGDVVFEQGIFSLYFHAV